MYQDKVNSLTADGVWNVAMSDLIPLAMANVLQKKITIYSSKLNCPLIQIEPNISSVQLERDLETIYLAYLAVPGYKHYNACRKAGLRDKATVNEPDPNPEQSNNKTTEQIDEVNHATNTPKKGTSILNKTK